MISSQRIAIRLTFALALLALTRLLSRGSAAASTLTPAPPDGASCHTTGSGIFCHGDFTFSGTNVVTDISCGTFEVLVTFTGRVTAATFSSKVVRTTT
jgi:hypothetical protein